MARAYTKGAKLRAKKLAGIPEIADIPKRQPNGQRRDRADRPRDPQKTALDARCRQMGMDPSKEARKRVQAPHISCQVGKVMDRTLSAGETDRRWKAFTAMLAAEAAYFRHYVDRSEYPRSAAMQMVRERVEAEASTTPDLRTDDEKASAAKAAWRVWQSILHRMDRNCRIAVQLAKRDTFELWNPTTATPTPLGIKASFALGWLADEMEKMGR